MTAQLPETPVSSIPPNATPKKSKLLVQSSTMETIDQAFKLISTQYEPELIVRKAALQIQDWLVEDVIRWARDNPDNLARVILTELFSPLNQSPTSPPNLTKPNPEYVRLAEALIINSNRFLKEDPVALAIILLRIAAGRVFFKSAQIDVKLSF